MKFRVFFFIVCTLALALPVRAQYAIQPDISVPYEKPAVFGVPEACIVSGLTVSAVGFGNGSSVKDGLQPYQVLCTAGLGCALAGVVMFVVSDSCYKSAAFRNVGLRDVSLSVGGTPDGVGLVCRF